MCTILTIDYNKYQEIGVKQVIERIESDSYMNNDGASMVFLDPLMPDTNVILRTMNVYLMIETVKTLMNAASDEARVFIHLRAATTSYNGVAYTHAFDNGGGRIFMHNGVIKNPNNYAVDSFQLLKLNTNSGQELLKELSLTNETFANILTIDADNYQYSMVRLIVGTLYTDGNGNYSTNMIKGHIDRPVGMNTAKDYDIGLADDPEAEVKIYLGDEIYDWDEFKRYNEEFDLEEYAAMPSYRKVHYKPGGY